MAEVRRSCVTQHTAFISDRGGAGRVMTLLDMSELTWRRETDAVSVATVTIVGDACRRQSASLGQIEPRRHELVIYRGDDRVWEGPVVSVSLGRNRVKIIAHDVLEYLGGRPMSKYWPGPDGGGPSKMTDRVREIITHELSQPYTAPGAQAGLGTIPAWEGVTPPANVLPYLEVRNGEILTTASVLPFQMSVLEHLQNLARGGLNYTTVGRRIVVWDSANSLGRLRTMTESDIDGDPQLVADGAALVAVQHVIGQPEEGALESNTDNVGSYVRDLSYYGPWANIHTRNEEVGENENVQVALSTQARGISAGKMPLPIELIIGGDSSIRLDSTVTIGQLVAGAEVPIVARLMGRTMNQTQRIESIAVVENDKGEAVTAKIGNPKKDEAV